jgi:hypothetical protein
MARKVSRLHDSNTCINNADLHAELFQPVSNSLLVLELVFTLPSLVLPTRLVLA